MKQYYLMSQLPSLDGVGDTTPLPITEEAFYELCSRFLSQSNVAALQELSLVPDRNGSFTGNSLVSQWNREERLLRLALGTLRSAKLKKPFDAGTEVIPPQTLQAARTVSAMTDPLEAELFLNNYRLEMLDRLRPLDGFCEDALFYYALKLKLLQRLRRFDKERGKDAYKNIYNSILYGDSQESES